MNAQELLEHYARVRARLNNPPNAVVKPALRLVIDPNKPRSKHRSDSICYAYPIGPVIPEFEDRIRVKSVSAKEIIFEVAHKHGISPIEIFGDRRCKHIIDARHEAIARVSEEKSEWSLTQIGRFFNRDHTTIIHAIRKVKGTERDGRKIGSKSKTFGGAP